MNRKITRILPVIAVIVIAGIVFLCTSKPPEVEIRDPLISTANSSDNVMPSSVESSEEEGIWIYLSGAVIYPGVYYLPQGSRLFEAVELAGGLLIDAASDAVNLAQSLEDGMHIYIPGEDTQGQIPDAMPAQTSDGRININTATMEELMTLPGIGESKARAIIAYRESSPFMHVEEIMNVSGIKEGSFEKIKDRIKV